VINVELRNVSLRFGHVEALRDVSFRAQSGRVTCLLGDNGAGKSSLIRILSGVHPQSSGDLLIDGEPVLLGSPRRALDFGIATVHQDLGLIPLMSVWRNFVLGAEPARGRGPLRRIDVGAARSAANNALSHLGIELRDVEQPVGSMSGGERQSLAIARAIHRGARMLILDEPTAALGVKQAEIVLRNVVRAKERGVGVILVTHNPQHAYEVGERFVVLQQGSVLAAHERAETNPASLAGLMSGVRQL
jgi:simple sugar transport system ATP-binding protein